MDGLIKLIIVVFVVIDCGQLPTPEKAKKVVETSTRINGRVIFECKEKGYQIRGSETRTCLENGTWSGVAASCESIHYVNRVQSELISFRRQQIWVDVVEISLSRVLFQPLRIGKAHTLGALAAPFFE